MSRITESARGQPCTLRLEFICCADPATTVWCHVRNKRTAGVGMKPPDLPGFYGCLTCHDEFDRRTQRMERQAVRAAALDAVAETMKRLTEIGLVKVG